MPQFFITSTGTGIGKTLVTTALGWQLQQAGKTVCVLKPVISGFEEGEENDTTAILRSLEQEITPETIAAVSPWRFTAPLSPDVAAAREGRQIDSEALVTFCEQERNSEYTLIEGIGGVMVPLNEKHTTLDIMQALGCPVILVTGSYLGALSHTLTAIAVLRQRAVPLQAIIISESQEPAMSLEETKASLASHLDVPVFALPRIKDSIEMWRDTPDLTEVVRPCSPVYGGGKKS